MLFYVIFILSVVILMGNRPVNKNRKLGYGSYIGITIIILVSILRFDVGWDYPGYYETVYPSLDTYAIDRFEPFNKIICQLVSYTKWPPLLFIIYGLITYILVFSTLRKYTDNLFLATLTYLAFFYTTSLGPIRQGVALAIVLYAYRYLVTKAYLKYIGAVVIAGMFHYTAFVCILIPVIFYFMTFPRMILVLIIIGVGIRVIIRLYAEYFGYTYYLLADVEYSGGSLISYVYPLVIISLCVLSWKKRDWLTRKLLYVTSFGAIWPFVLGGHLGGRIGWYFLIYLCVLVPHVLVQCKTTLRSLYATALVVYFLLFVYITTLNPIEQPLTPYQSILTTDTRHPIFKQER